MEKVKKSNREVQYHIYRMMNGAQQIVKHYNLKEWKLGVIGGTVECKFVSVEESLNALKDKR